MTTAPEYPKTLAIFRDCHAKNNLIVTAYDNADELLYRKMAKRKHWQVAVCKRKPAEPTCDNCVSMKVVGTDDGNHRRCDLYGQWIPDNEQSPVCRQHIFKGAFILRLTPLEKKGGGQ